MSDFYVDTPGTLPADGVRNPPTPDDLRVAQGA